VLPEAVDHDDCGFHGVIGNRLFYWVRVTSRRQRLFALVREPHFEKGYASPNDLYDDLKGANYHSDDPLRNGALVFVRRESFTRSDGTVLSIPVFKVVAAVP